MPQVTLATWLAKGTYPRLFLPILLIILLATGVRYHFLLSTETEEVHARSAAELSRIGLLVLPVLTQNPASGRAAIEHALQEHAGQHVPALRSLLWQVDGATTLELHPPALQQTAPAWLVQYLRITPPQKTFVQPLPQGQSGRLTLVLQPEPLVDQVWKTVLVQARLSALNIFIILLLLTLLLRANERMLGRLAHATDQFKHGHLDTRMDVSGTLEARAVAATFNAMADQVQSLVVSLKETQQQQGEQLHFTRQLIDALPLPVFVRDSKGLCLDVNKAWEHLFKAQASHQVGQPMPQGFCLPAAPDTLPAARAQQPGASEIQVRAADQAIRDMAYYQAPFTTANGMTAGTIGTLVDITERKHAQEALRAEKERAEVTLASIGDGVITTDVHGRIESINEAAQLMTGYTAEQAVGRMLDGVFRFFEEPVSLTTPSGFGHELRSSTLHQAAQQVLIHRSGEHYAIEYTAAPIQEGNGASAGCVLVFRNVTETRDLREKLSWHARHDALTGLHNRAALAERLTHAIFTTRQRGKLLAVCMLDLDHFQSLNEQHGTRTGDRLLKQVALRLSAFVTPSDAVARMGGDEFALLLGDLPDARAVEERVSLLLSQLSQPYAIDNLTLPATASIGVAVFPQDDASPDTLLRHADQAMCHAKRTGRNQAHLFDVQQDQEVQTLHSQQTRVAQALRGGEFRLHYQPKVNLRTGEILGMEALLRWQHPGQGLLGPQHVFPLIDDTDLIVEVGEWVLEHALMQLRAWTAAGMPWTVSVNIAARHFHRPDFVERLKMALQACPEVSPAQLELEILESAALEDVNYMRGMMQSCQALGVRFALDDFGTGFSSLSYLKRLPAETIKIDQSFVKGILEDHDDLTLVSAIVGLATAFQRKVIAEGVETQAHCEKLLHLGCELAQGYGIARPMPADKVPEWAQGYRAATATAQPGACVSP
ncbi:EAL domain-containing protein [Simplicispira lacusdiani]|uniref:EAL domain-containing protein n=1 Tax=Simplicispira lacusdiani TaxID=2213010 RepID=UPI000E70DB45|nr:EAL domain-containing protein [Simplicispira lacusdiani]